jgi:hypothetical protein
MTNVGLELEPREETVSPRPLLAVRGTVGRAVWLARDSKLAGLVKVLIHPRVYLDP